MDPCATLDFRLRLKYPDLFPLPRVSPPELQRLKTQLQDIDFNRGVIVCHPRDLRKAVFVYGLLHLGEEVSLTARNAYQLIAHHFREGDPEEFE